MTTTNKNEFMPEGIVILSNNVVYDALQREVIFRIDRVHLSMSVKEFIDLCQELTDVHKYIINLASCDIIQEDPSGEEN
jgi:hypothetical protein